MNWDRLLAWETSWILLDLVSALLLITCMTVTLDNLLNLCVLPICKMGCLEDSVSQSFTYVIQGMLLGT